MEFKPKRQSPSTASTTTSTTKPRIQRQVQKVSPPEAQVALQREVKAFTSTPFVAQRQAVKDVFQASSLQRQEETRIDAQREPLQRQAAGLSATLPSNAIQTALQRQVQASAPTQQRPVTPGDWAIAMQREAERIEGQNLNTQQHQQFMTLQRHVMQTLVQGFRQDRQPAVQRYAEYGAHLATLQRHPISGEVAQATMRLIPPGERPMLQRAVDEALQRQQEQDAQDAAALNLHALQRQLAELDEQSTRPVMQRIQERRGAGSPLPEAVQRHLEQGLNHDLSGVRIHDDAEADKMAKGVNAIAFTTGKDIFFQSGKFNPNTQSGMELLAHEVTHTVQQSKGQVGKGIDPDSGLEQEAREAGKKLALKPQTQGKSPRKPFPSRAAFTPTTTFQRQTAQNPMKPPANLTVGKIGVIKHTDGANLRSQPNPKGSLIQPNPLAPGTKVGVISQTADGWSKVSLPNGKTGFVQTVRVTTDLPDPGSTLIKVPPGSTAIGIAERYYKTVIKPGQDLRFYVNVLEFVNKQRGTGAFQNDKALKGGNLLWVPSPTYAQTLVGTVKDGSITGGALAKTNALMGNSPGANIMRSVLESPTHIKEVLGDAWKIIEKHWPAMLATTLAFVGAELLVGVLAAVPEPTTVTKFAAVGLQGLITAAAGAGAVMAGAAALKSAEAWLRTAWTAGGNASKIKAASKAFLQMIGNIAMAVASAAGAKTSLAKTRSLLGNTPKPPATGLETRGYRPQPGERSTTKAEYKQINQIARVKAYDASNRTLSQLGRDTSPTFRPGETKAMMQSRVKAARAALASRFPEMNKIQAKVLGAYDSRNPGPLNSDMAGTFMGSAYVEMELTAPTVLRRAGAAGKGKEFGRFYTTDQIVGETQARIDKAVRRQWINHKTGEVTGESPLEVMYETRFPAGTKVYVGQVAPQFGRGLSSDPSTTYFGGTGQIVLTAPWETGKIIKSQPLVPAIKR